MNYVSKIFSGLVAIAAMTIFTSCDKERSGATGWSYNEEENGGFERQEYVEQETGPGLVLVEGGTFTMGRVEDDLNFTWDNIPRRVTVSSFYMDETEVTNQYWLDYLHWLRLVYSDTYPEIINRALPDTNIWREVTEYNEPLVDYYLRHPAYRDYPVVGVSWLQASDYCVWRTDRVNEVILIREGLMNYNPTGQADEEHFTTDTYLAGQYQGDASAGGLKDYNPKGTGSRNVTMSDGILLPRYRLPTEAEWEYAALGLIGNSFQELITDRRTYPWNGHYVRNDDNGGRFFGTIRANFVRGSGDYMGVAGYLNDNADISAPVYAYPPNDYGLYNMSGNVSEWVMDVYRPLSPEDKSEFRPFRGNVYKTRVLNSDGSVADKYDKNIYDVDGVIYFLQKYQEQAGAKLTATDLTLLEQCNAKVAAAVEKQKERKEDEAQDMMQECMDLITDSESPIAPDLRDGVSDYIQNAPGELRTRNVTVEENIDRRNYRKSDYIDYVDGDFNSSIYYYEADKEQDKNRMYEWGVTTLINDRARVYKGGNWRDRAYYTIPGTRRFLDERRSMSTLGFRCAMDRLGSPTGIGGKE
ncbi:MAG: SUMF1/EgtB/PvdO family nonheme iron enzyme [Flavobacteriales bacterium]|nr:SUMF1/EgtB/PvdO family nonheme iron enzyme [Flavobacteriales bacterium]